MGILVIESPIPNSRIEGCCFRVGSIDSTRPCLFANTHATTWFRRNEILAHELGHAIFDSDSDPASIDMLEQDQMPLAEQRAQAFAQELLIPSEVLARATEATRASWANMTREQLADLVAETHVEQRLILAAATDARKISSSQAADFVRWNIWEDLRNRSQHALSTEEFIARIGKEAAAAWVGKRKTTTSGFSLRLPVSFVTAVLQATTERRISRGRAAALLMISDVDFNLRFGSLVPEF